MNQSATEHHIDNILLRHENEGVVTLTLNRPSQYNSLSEEMLAGIVQAMSMGNATLNEEATPDAVPITFSIALAKQ